MKGTHPDYKSPQPVCSIDNKIDPIIEKNLSMFSKEKNFMHENIKKIRKVVENKSDIQSKNKTSQNLGELGKSKKKGIFQNTPGKGNQSQV